MSGSQTIAPEEKNSNKNIWLAIALAIITSLTSLGTAFISKDKNSESSNSASVTTEFKVFKEKYKNDIKNFNKRIEENKKNLDMHEIVAAQVRSINKKRFEDIEKTNESLIVIAKDLKSKNNVLKRGVYNYINDKIIEAKSDSFKRDLVIKEEIDKNTNRSIMCYASLTKEEVQKGKSILSIINGEGINKSLGQQKIVEKALKHLDQNLLKKVVHKKN